MAKHDKIDLEPYRQPAAEAYADDVVDPNGKGVYTPDYVNGLIRAAYLAGVTSIAPEGVTARYEYTLMSSNGWPAGSYRQRTRAINECNKANANRARWGGQTDTLYPERRVVIEGGWTEI